MKNIPNKIIINILSLCLIQIAIQAHEPKEWGENVSGVTTKFNSQNKEIALTFDACGGSVKSSQYDSELINFLIKNKIQATLFLNARWIKSNPDIFKKLQENKLFELENHGTEHLPLSTNGKSIYGLAGTNSEKEVISEVEENNKLFEKFNQKRPLFFRSGTAFYDEVAVGIVRKNLNMEIAGFSIIADAGATLNYTEVAKRVSKAQSGDILIAHMNHPESGTSKGMKIGINNLIKKGFKFVKLSDVKKQLIRVK